MSNFVQIPADTFTQLQMDAGLILSRFNPAAPAISPSDIITATTGGITVTCQPTFSDLGSDVDNCPTDMKELKHLDSWLCTVATSILSVKTAAVKFALGCADVNNTTGAISPRADLQQTDFADVWFVGRKAGTGFIAVKLINALSTAGFVLTTNKNGKGSVAITLTGHGSITNQGKIPMEVYSSDSSADSYSITELLTHVESTNTAGSIAASGEFSATLSAATGYEMASVIVMMGGEDITEDAYTSGTGAVAIASVTGNITIIATATATS